MQEEDSSRPLGFSGTLQYDRDGILFQYDRDGILSPEVLGEDYRGSS